MQNFHESGPQRLHRARGRFEAMGRRGGGWGGPGGSNWGDWGGFGDSFRIGRMLASGDLRLVALYFIEQQPRHGYDLIKAIEERTGGIYVPSPGVVYPALTFLEEAGYVTSAAEGNKRLYTITAEGKAHLADNRDAVDATLAHFGKLSEQVGKLRRHFHDAEQKFGAAFDRDMDDVAPEVNAARRALKDAIREAARNRDPHNQRRLADILQRAADEIRRQDPAAPSDEIDI